MIKLMFSLLYHIIILIIVFTWQWFKVQKKYYGASLTFKLLISTKKIETESIFFEYH